MARVQQNVLGDHNGTNQSEVRQAIQATPRSLLAVFVRASEGSEWVHPFKNEEEIAPYLVEQNEDDENQDVTCRETINLATATEGEIQKFVRGFEFR